MMSRSHSLPDPLMKPSQQLPAGNPINETVAFSTKDGFRHTQEFKGLHCSQLQKVPPVACMFSKGLFCLSTMAVSPEKTGEAKYFFLVGVF